MDKLKPSGKSFDISKWEVWEAYRQVKANQGAPGVDGVTLEQFDEDLKNNLYKIWNRLSAGSYFPPPVKAVEIPKPHGGGTRTLGIPTIADRVPDGGGPAAGGEGRTDLSSRFLRVPAATVGSGRGRGMSGAVLEERLGDRSGYSEVLGCIVTLLLSLIVMVKTVLPGRLGAGYAGLFGVRCAGGRLAVRRA